MLRESLFFFFLPLFVIYIRVVPRNTAGTNKRIGLFDGIKMVSNAIYFDIPSLKPTAVEQIIRSLKEPSWNASYRYALICDALLVLLKHYATETTNVDRILLVLSREGYISRIIQNKVVRAELETEPKILTRLLEIQLEIRSLAST